MLRLQVILQHYHTIINKLSIDKSFVNKMKFDYFQNFQIKVIIQYNLIMLWLNYYNSTQLGALQK